LSGLAYKFLARGARGPISGFRWSQPAADRPGDWSPEDAVELCRRGVHACRPSELAFWLHEELWRVELDGPCLEGPDCLVAARGRLVQRIDAWSEEGGAQEFAVAVRDHALAAIAHHPERARLQGYVDDASRHVANGFRESPALAGLCAAMAVAQSRSEAVEEAYREERAWQSAWIVSRFELA